jgi:UDP-N-acetylglucosamine 2-epimerase (non-hydrolysing)
LSQDADAQTRLKKAGVDLLSRQSYTRFVHLLAGARFVLTDGGSNQTECAYLGLPCLILREKTELADGIGQNCVLSQFDKHKVSEFLSAPDKYKQPMLQLGQSPSQKIIETLAHGAST